MEGGPGRHVVCDKARPSLQILPGVKVIIAHTETKGPLGDSHLGEVRLGGATGTWSGRFSRLAFHACRVNSAFVHADISCWRMPHSFVSSGPRRSG